MPIALPEMSKNYSIIAFTGITIRGFFEMKQEIRTVVGNTLRELTTHRGLANRNTSSTAAELT